MDILCSACGGRHPRPGGKYCKFLSTGTRTLPGVMASVGLTGEEKEQALGDIEDIPDRDSPDYVPYLESRIGVLTQSMKKLELSTKAKEAEDKLFNLFSRYKALERSASMDKTSVKGGGQNQADAGASQQQSPHQWASISDMVSQAGGDLGKMHPSAHVEGVPWDKMSFRDFMLGMCRVSIYMEELHIPTTMYKRHMESILEMASSNIYTTEAFLRYDRYVTLLVQEGKLQDWLPSHSHSQNLYFTRVYTFEHVNSRRKSYASGKSYNSPSKNWWNENWPSSICYCYNWRVCNRVKCNHKHECSECGLDHKALVCPKQPVDPVVRFSQGGGSHDSSGK